MKILEVLTINPQALRDDINDKMITGDIRSWEFDDSGKAISHKGKQYVNQFILNFILMIQKEF